MEDQMEMQYQLKYGFDAKRNAYIGMVIMDGTVMTIGVEGTKTGIIEWLQRAVDMKPWISGNPCPPDMYDRVVGTWRKGGGAI